MVGCITWYVLWTEEEPVEQRTKREQSSFFFMLRAAVRYGERERGRETSERARACVPGAPGVEGDMIRYEFRKFHSGCCVENGWGRGESMLVDGEAQVEDWCRFPGQDNGSWRRRQADRLEVKPGDKTTGLGVVLSTKLSYTLTLLWKNNLKDLEKRVNSKCNLINTLLLLQARDYGLEALGEFWKGCTGIGG